MNNLLTKNTRMKKLIIMCALSILNIGSFAQNGGISNENASLKLEYVSSANGITVVKVTNKDTCESNVRVQWGQVTRRKYVSGLSSDTFNLTSQNGRCFIMATSTSPCRNRYDGQVEINYCLLPIKFEYLYAKQIDKHTVSIEFKALSTDGEDRFNIQMSKDGVHFTTVSVILPDPIETNKIYKVIVKL